MAERFTYPVDVERDEAGFLLVTFPDLAEAATDNRSMPEAMSEAADCLAEALAGRIGRGEPIPQPSAAAGRPTVVPPALVAAKAALHVARYQAGLSKVALAERLGCDEKEVRRLLDPRHNSRLDRLEMALAALGKRLIIEVRDAA